ncbi:hypothetical protein [Psychrobacillus sp. L4]|uniref:hypothetical protein n=1 Tax=Psychrobacillus sp. L4 TaxID=3236892 RepID=UPI0036F2B441
MIISYDFGVNLNEYASRGTANFFPLLETCPNCNCLAHGNLHRNGYYWRYGIAEDVTVKIPICRFRCVVCKVSVSILPDFLIPYFQHTIHTILGRVHQLLQRKQACGGRQLLRFHLKRYLKNIHWIHCYFVDKGPVFGMSNEIKKEATKYMKMILDFGESPFLRRSWGHLSKYFMAN